MKYAVIYQSKSGNTRKIAEQIYESIRSEEKEIIDVDEKKCIPAADVYLIGFGIHNGYCSLNIIDCLEKLPEAKYALFATCGNIPADEYKRRLQGNLDVWLPDSGEYLGMFLCQGNVDQERRNIIISKMPTRETQLKKLFEMGSSHPDEADLQEAEAFAEHIQDMLGDC